MQAMTDQIGALPTAAPISMPASGAMPESGAAAKVAIIGAGFSGTLLALHLLRQAQGAITVVLIERRPLFGRGLAYSTTNANHLLNVRAGGMSAFRDQPNHFLQWLNQAPHRWGKPPVGAAGFVSRGEFGTYVSGLLHDAATRQSAQRQLDLVGGEVTAVALQSGKPVLTLANGRTIAADFAVVATGNAPPLADASLYDNAYYCADPWSPEALSGLDEAAPLLLIGSGLTAMDVVISLLDRGHSGPITAMSRRGLLPHAHAAATTLAGPRPDFPTSVLGLLRMLRHQAATAQADGTDWRPIVDALRPFTSDLWQALSVADRARFLRHLRPYWDTHRHRMAPQIVSRIETARAAGQFRVVPGRLRAIVPNGAAATVLYRPRHAAVDAEMPAARVINCSGPGSDYARLADPVVRSLLGQGLARPDDLRLGLDITAHCALRARTGAISRTLFAVGPLTKGMFWEMVAVPDIRRQCEVLAGHLCGMLLATDGEGASGSTEGGVFVI